VTHGVVMSKRLRPDFVGGLTYFEIGVGVADVGEVHAAGQVGGHDVAAGGVEDGGFEAGVGGAECLPSEI
jgi:hypothetical protein